MKTGEFESQVGAILGLKVGEVITAQVLAAPNNGVRVYLAIKPTVKQAAKLLDLAIAMTRANLNIS